MNSRRESDATGRPKEAEQRQLRTVAEQARTLRRRWNWIAKRLPPGASARLMRLHRLGWALVAVFVVSVFIILRQLLGLMLWLTEKRVRVLSWSWSVAWWDAWESVLLVAALLAAAGAVLAGRMISNRVLRELEQDGWKGDPLLVEMALLEWDQAGDLEQDLEKETAEAAEQARFEKESSQAPSWWARELSGAHLVWWVALIVVTANHQWHLLSPRIMTVAVWPVLVFGILAKVVVGWVGYGVVARTPATKRALTRYYRWWAVGWAPTALALVGPPALTWLLTIIPGG